MCESVSFFDGFGFKENFIPDNKVRVLKTCELKNLFLVKQLRHKWIETRISRIHTNWISRICDSSWNSCRASCTSYLGANHSNQITQLVFDIAGSRNGMSNFLAQ